MCSFYLWTCNSIRGFVHLSINLSVCRSVSLLVMIKSKSGKTSILAIFCVCLCERGGYWGFFGGWTPLPTHTQRYYDPASFIHMDIHGLCRKELCSRWTLQFWGIFTNKRWQRIAITYLNITSNFEHLIDQWMEGYSLLKQESHTIIRYSLDIKI